MTDARPDGRTADKFWYDAPEVLVAHNRLLEFVPSRRMSSNEQMNAAVRFSVYLTILLLILGGGSRLLFLPAVVAAGTVMFERHGLNAPGKVFAMLGKAAGAVSGEHRYEAEHDAGAEAGIEEFSAGAPVPSQDARAGIEHGDDDGALAETSPIGSNLVPQRTPADDAHRDPNACQRPSRHNPFMNVMVGDYRYRPRRAAACTRQQQADIKRDVNRQFEHGLYQNVGEAWGTNNSQRQFFTMPYTTIPNNQESFSKWLYDTPPILKEQGLIEHPKYALSGVAPVAPRG